MPPRLVGSDPVEELHRAGAHMGVRMEEAQPHVKQPRVTLRHYREQLAHLVIGPHALGQREIDPPAVLMAELQVSQPVVLMRQVQLPYRPPAPERREVLDEGIVTARVAPSFDARHVGP